MRAGLLIHTAAARRNSFTSLPPSDLHALRSDTTAYSGRNNEEVNVILNMLDALLAKITDEKSLNEIRVAEAVDAAAAVLKATREISLITTIKRAFIA
jgi:hypothetical protein